MYWQLTSGGTPKYLDSFSSCTYSWWLSLLSSVLPSLARVLWGSAWCTWSPPSGCPFHSSPSGGWTGARRRQSSVSFLLFILLKTSWLFLRLDWFICRKAIQLELSLLIVSWSFWTFLQSYCQSFMSRKWNSMLACPKILRLARPLVPRWVPTCINPSLTLCYAIFRTFPLEM